jgi:hypothetical protein
VALLAALAASVSTPCAVAAVSPAELLRTYQPVTVLAPGELYRPTSVDGFLGAASLEQRRPEGTWVPVFLPALPAENPPGCASACWRLNVRACSPTSGPAGLECYAREVDQSARVVHGRVVRAGARIVLQYWFFYTYNFWSPLLAPNDFIWRTHEGDWELVSVVLSRAGTPLFVGYSQHCTGKRRSWSRVPRWGRTRHPIAYVALGSHGHYFSPGPQLVDLSCWPQAAEAIFRAHRVTARDFTGRGAVLGPARLGVEPTQLRRLDVPNVGWVAFAGSWGEQGFFHAPDPIGTVGFGAGPDTPPLQRSWREPLRTVLRWPQG